MVKTTLPTDSTERKNLPIAGGCRDYFPAALMGVARWSKLGNDKHNPGQPLHHARGKSMDHEECIERHSMDLADLQAAYLRTSDVETGKKLVQLMLDEYDARAWRALAASQEFRERHGLAPLAPAARLPEPALTLQTVELTLEDTQPLVFGSLATRIDAAAGEVVRSPYIDDIVGRDRPETAEERYDRLNPTADGEYGMLGRQRHKDDIA